ncbi:MAG: carboxylating nicotinate-nucleotide diphosphorylase [Simkaniaceae bacterium]|nr:carboxylating nicotinate-nucleotide diphosphorylase [Simkaniaceae bacterium]
MTTLSPIISEKFRSLVQQMLVEDCAGDDVTTTATLPIDRDVSCEIVMKQEGIVGGLFLIPYFFEQLGKNVEITPLVTEGQFVPAGSTIVKLNGSAQAILSCERSIINVIQHISSIATETKKYVEIATPFGCDILDTRKTLPTLRFLQKYAVSLGGGKNHRSSLAEKVLIKDNHLKIGKMGEIVREARIKTPGIFIEIEIDYLSQLRDAIALKPDAIMLDNMDPDEIKQAVKIAPESIYLEASGGITLLNLSDYAKTGVSGISIGALTHSVNALDISLNIGPS